VEPVGDGGPERPGGGPLGVGPGPPEALEGGHELAGHLPHDRVEVRRDGRPLGPGGGHPTPGPGLAEQVGQRLRGLHDVVGEGEQHGVDRLRDHGLLGARLQQGHVGPAGGLHPGPGRAQHLRARVDPDQPAAGADGRLDPLEVQPRAAADVQDHLARLEAELGDGPAAVGLEPGRAQVVAAGDPAVQGRRGVGVVVSHGAHMVPLASRPGYPDRPRLQPRRSRPAAPMGSRCFQLAYLR
jgi:hypothetical protein